MYFIFEMAFGSSKNYIAEFIRAYGVQEGVELSVLQSKDKIILSFQEHDVKIEPFLRSLEEVLPASLFLGKGKHYFAKEKPAVMPVDIEHLPLNIAPCPSCQKEMFDVSSRRYYYPFTSCNHCGTQRSFLTHYPYERANTGMKFLVPCRSCKEESQTNALRRDYPLISCIECGIALRMLDKEVEHLAVEKGDYLRLFKAAAGAIAEGKHLLVKSLHGYRKFFLPRYAKAKELTQSILLFVDAGAFNRHLMMVEQEFNALLSIERPLLRVASRSEEIKALYGSSALVKYPDEGMSMLLAAEALKYGVQYLAYVECDGNEEADYLVDFDIPINPQRDTKLFINQDTKFFISGERICFPALVEPSSKRVTVAEGLAAVEVEGRQIIDSAELFESVQTPEIYVLEEEAFRSGHSNEKRFEGYKASMLSVLAEHHRVGQKAIGVHFDTALHFLYYNGKKVINAVPANPFEAEHLWEKIASLREGSDRLVENYKKAYPELWERLDKLEGDRDIFEVTAIVLGLEDESLEGISATALSFLGKGGLQIDTRVKENRFDNYAFLSSIMSYQLGGVQSDLMCYSIYESFGDYIGEIVPQLAEKTGTRIVTLTGETFANQSLYGRIVRTLGQYERVMNKNFPIGKENAAYGALYL